MALTIITVRLFIRKPMYTRPVSYTHLGRLCRGLGGRGETDFRHPHPPGLVPVSYTHLTAEEHSVIGGLGEAVCAVLSEKLPTPVRRVGVQDKFGCSGPEIGRAHV